MGGIATPTDWKTLPQVPLHSLLTTRDLPYSSMTISWSDFKSCLMSAHSKQWPVWSKRRSNSFLCMGISWKMAHGINMCWTMITEQNTPRLVRESGTQLALTFFMGKVSPNYGLKMPWVNRHSLVYFLCQIDNLPSEQHFFLFSLLDLSLFCQIP